MIQTFILDHNNNVFILCNAGIEQSRVTPHGAFARKLTGKILLHFIAIQTTLRLSFGWFKRQNDFQSSSYGYQISGKCVFAKGMLLTLRKGLLSRFTFYGFVTRKIIRVRYSLPYYFCPEAIYSRLIWISLS